MINVPGDSLIEHAPEDLEVTVDGSLRQLLFYTRECPVSQGGLKLVYMERRDVRQVSDVQVFEIGFNFLDTLLFP